MWCNWDPWLDLVGIHTTQLVRDTGIILVVLKRSTGWASEFLVY
jgi:hypothetical protein